MEIKNDDVFTGDEVMHEQGIIRYGVVIPHLTYLTIHYTHID
jgi:hypothetical protein